MIMSDVVASRAAAPARAWRSVLERIEQDLLDGRLQPGDHLPPERELAARLGVGRSSVREALRVLDVMGLIHQSTGSGPGSGAIIVATPRGGLAQFLRLQVAAHGLPFADIVDTRLLLEEHVVADLATRPDRDLAPVREALAATERPGLAIEEFLALDAQFHVSLADAATNQVVAATMAGLRSAIESYVLEGSVRIVEWDAMAARLRDEHRAILAAVEAGEPELARRLVHDHIAGYYAAAGLTGA
jgi:GntR family transcriptional regulator, transcriptional repressor for pyruvate dehydrogenase complex